MIRINLAPREERRSSGGIRVQMPGLNLGVVFLVLYVITLSGIAMYWAGLYREEARLTEEIANANRELATLKPITAQANKVKEQLADLKKRVATIEQLTKDQSKPIRIFDAFANVMPNDVWLTRMEERGNIMKVSGTAFSETAVADLMANIRASGKFKEVDIVVARQDLAKAPRLVTFEVTFRFEG